MKHISRILILLLVVILPIGVFAQQRTKNVVLPANQTVQNNYFGAGSNVRVEGTINGDAYVAGGTVLVDGTINGDLLAAGGTVLVRGDVTQNIRVAGGTVTITGNIGRNVTVAGGTVTIDKNATIHGSVVTLGGTFSQFGTIHKDLVVAGGTTTLGGTIKGNVRANSDTISVPAGASIAGSFSYLSANNAQIEQGASISGKLNHEKPTVSQVQRTRSVKSAMTGFLWGKIISLVAMYMIGLLFINFFPRFTERVVEKVKEDAWKSIGAGLLAFVITPLLVLFLLATLVGIPFAFGLLFAWIISVYIGKLFVAMYLGQWVAGATHQKVGSAWALFTGLVLHLILTLIPVFGWIIGVFVMLWGFGALLLAKKELYHAWRKKDLL